MATYNITAEKAYKLLDAFPSKVMYINGPEGYLDAFVGPLKTSGYTVVSLSTVRKMCKSDETFIANIKRRIYNASGNIILYGQLTLGDVESIFGEPHNFSYIYVYPNSKTAADKLKEYGIETPPKEFLKKHMMVYKEHSNIYEKMLIILM